MSAAPQGERYAELREALRAACGAFASRYAANLQRQPHIVLRE